MCGRKDSASSATLTLPGCRAAGAARHRTGRCGKEFIVRSRSRNRPAPFGSTIHLALVLRSVIDDLLADRRDKPVGAAAAVRARVRRRVPGRRSPARPPSPPSPRSRSCTVEPPIAAVVVVAAVAAFAGDAACYAIGRTIGVDRWTLDSRTPRVVALRAWAQRRLAAQHRGDRVHRPIHPVRAHRCEPHRRRRATAGASLPRPLRTRRRRLGDVPVVHRRGDRTPLPRIPRRCRPDLDRRRAARRLGAGRDAA